MTFGRFRSENVSSAKFPFCKLFPIYRKHHRFKSHRGERLPFLGSKSRLPGSCQERHTSKRKSKCFYFKIHHLQLSSKFVSPICRLHFSRHILVIDLNLYFLHALPLFFSLSPSLSLFLGNDGRIPCFISGAQNFKYINTNGYRQPRVNKFKKFSRFSLTEEEAAAWLLQCFSPSFDPSFGKFVLWKRANHV